MSSTISKMDSTTGGGNNLISKAANDVMGKDDFLKLLTTELRNQDPLSPMDNKDFISQMAQFSSLEQMNNVAKSMENMNANMTILFQHSLLSQGAALIGKQVAGMDSSGETLIEGTVEAVKWLDGNPQLQLRMADGSLRGMEMNEIISVSEAKQAVDSGTPDSTTEPSGPAPGSEETPV